MSRHGDWLPAVFDSPYSFLYTQKARLKIDGNSRGVSVPTDLADDRRMDSGSCTRIEHEFAGPRYAWSLISRTELNQR